MAEGLVRLTLERPFIWVALSRAAAFSTRGERTMVEEISTEDLEPEAI
jgi:hypothetical protein